MTAPETIGPGGPLPLRLLRTSQALRTALGFGLGGVGFALGNLLLARVLPPTQFGVFTLFFALVQIGVTVGPIGLEGQVNRRPGGEVGPGRALLTSSVVAAVIAILASTQYRLEAALVVALVVSIIAGAISRVAAAIFQSRLRFGIALTLMQGISVLLIGMGAAAEIAGGVRLWLLAVLVAGYYVISAGTGWGILARERAQGPSGAHSFLEGLSLLGITAAAMILMQLERLLAPHLLTLEALATFAVVTTLVGSPLRMLQQGAGYTLLPRLSKASSPKERRRLVRRETAVVVLIGGTVVLVTFVATPWIGRWLLHGKYDLPTALMIAAVVSGSVKLADGFATTMVWALGSPRQLALLNWVSWTCAGIGVAAAWFGARWGLIGLMYGVSFGWVCRGAVAGTLAAKLLRGARVTHDLPPAPVRVLS
jgi:O-antigen/teichoic acid export membrane protein